MIGQFGPYFVFILDALSYLISFLFLSFVQLRPLKQEEQKEDSQQPEKRQMKKELLEGIQVMRETPVLRGLIPISLMLNFLFAPLNLFLVIKISDVFHGGAEQLSYLSAAFGVGMLVGSVSVGVLSKRWRAGVLYFAGLFGMGLGLVVFSVSETVGVGLAGLLAAGFFNVFINVPFSTTIQRVVSEEKLGRVFGLLGIAVEGLVPLSNACFGFLFRYVMINPVLIVLSISYLGVSALALTKRVLRQMG